MINKRRWDFEFWRFWIWRQYKTNLQHPWYSRQSSPRCCNRKQGQRKGDDLAVFLSMYAVCTEPVKPCGHCEQCHKAKNKAHADIKYVELPNDRKQNSIEQMREIIGDSVIKPNEADAKVYIFPFADTRLSDIVQNSFLKLLEEPPRMYISLCSAKTPRNCSRQFSPVQVYSVWKQKMFSVRMRLQVQRKL